MEPTKEIQKLNEWIGQELGITPYGDPLYKWEWSNDVMWPAFATGKFKQHSTEGGLLVMANEYVQLPQTDKRDCWMVTKWFGPDDLPDWESQFPGAPYPSRGFRIFTDWYNDPGKNPSFEDTQKLIWALRSQRDMTQKELEADMEAEMSKKERAESSIADDAIEDCIPAFVNPTPGKRGGDVSIPYTNFDRKRDGTLIQ